MGSFTNKSLIKKSRSNENEFKDFIDLHFFTKNSPLSDEVITNNIEVLKKMDASQQSLIKARAKEFEESNDPSKYFPTILTLFGLIITFYSLLTELTKNSSLIIGANIVVAVILVLYATRIFTNTIGKRSTAVFFNTLINSIDFEK